VFFVERGKNANEKTLIPEVSSSSHQVFGPSVPSPERRKKGEGDGPSGEISFQKEKKGERTRRLLLDGKKNGRRSLPVGGRCRATPPEKGRGLGKREKMKKKKKKSPGQRPPRHLRAPPVGTIQATAAGAEKRKRGGFFFGSEGRKRKKGK